MAKNWNLQDIRPAQPRKKRPVRPQNVEEPASSSKRPIRKNSAQTTKIDKKSKTLLFLGIGASMLLIGSFIFGIFLTGAEVSVYPKYKDPNVNTATTAYVNPPNNNSLGYEVMTLEAEGERQVTATGQEEVTQQAEGSITIYNNYTKESIRLVTNTRFESPEGLIFKLSDPAIVPGYTIDDAGKKVPGSTVAEVYADEVGEEYNISESSFTIPGFEGEPEFDDIYAKSNEAFIGGFDGLQFVVDDSELATAQQSLRTELRNSLLERVAGEQPAGFIVFDDSVVFSYETLPSVDAGDNMATIKERVSLHVPLFKEEDLTSFIASATIPGYENEPLRIENTDQLTFSYASTTPDTITSDEGIEITLQGRPRIIWKYDTQAFISELVGKNKNALQTILGAYPAIEKAKVTSKPFWKNSFPNDPKKITLVEIIEDQE